MAIVVPESRSYELPEEGQQQAVLAQVEVLPDEEVEFKNEKTGEMKTRTVHPCYFHFELSQEGKDGKRLTARIKLNLSRSDQSNLWQFLQDWKVKEFFEDPTFDLETLVGRNANLTISHTFVQAKNKTYANIKAILPLSAKQKDVLKVRDFVPF